MHLLRTTTLFGGLALAAGCATAPRQAPEPLPGTRTEQRAAPPTDSIAPPADFARAVARGTRTATGEPGPRYWQQWASYAIDARVLPAAKRLEGMVRIAYFNRSPDTLASLHVDLTQNVHGPDAIRNEPMEQTGGITLGRVAVNGRAVPDDASTGARYQVVGTRLVVIPAMRVLPGDSVTLSIGFGFEIPQAGAGGRMGYDGDDLFFLAYWYPRMAVYDDVVGWHPDPFRGTAEFYHGFGRYEYTVEVPEGWVVVGTGELANEREVLAPAVRERLAQAAASDTVVAVISEADLRGPVTVQGPGTTLRWRFRADSVRDVAFSATRASVWDAVRASVGDRDGDGDEDFTRVDAIYRPTATRWRESARYGRHAITFLSRWHALPYPWPHMTSVEARQIIGGGMEYPMMTLIGDYAASTDTGLYGVTAHEFAHMWVPLLVSTDERRYSWMDEGMTEFVEQLAKEDFYPGTNFIRGEQDAYIGFALTGGEGPILRWSDFHYSPNAYTIASYYKPASALAALRGVLGEPTFERAYRAFVNTWKYRHPYPWDFFNSIERVSGRELDWFWRAWYAETWTLDQAIESVTAGDDGTRIVVANRGRAPMPVRLAITREDGEVIRREIPADVWLTGDRTTTLDLPAGAAVTRVEIDPERVFPDVRRDNNVWRR
ncbi:MAG TPA: M1 family metallopeptidase [Gemmatimonadaceae bacterium]